MKSSNLFFLKSLFVVVASMALIGGLVSCSSKEDTNVPPVLVSQKVESPVVGATNLKSAVLGLPSVQLSSVILYAGQNMNAGTVTVDEVDSNVDGTYDALRVTYQLTGNWQFDGADPVKFYAGLAVPPANNGGLILNNFLFRYTPAAGATSYTFDIPFSDSRVNINVCDNPLLYVAAHAGLTTTATGHQSAWGSGIAASGNNWSMYYTINLKDLTPPKASNPATLNVECKGDVPAPNISVVTDATDNCGSPTVAFVGEVSDGKTCPETITRTYSVTDIALNTITVTQTIIIQDKTAPTVTGTIAESEVEGCSVANAPAAVTTVEALTALGLTITDNCTLPLTVTSSDVAAGSCPLVVTRTYSVADACGNKTLVNQIIKVKDTTPPTAPNPVAINASCDNIPAPNVAVVTGAQDNCGSPVTVSFVGDVINGSGCSYTITRTYKVSDACGNFINVAQTINVADNTAPVLSGQGADATIACSAIPVFTAPTATDNCSTATVSVVGPDLIEAGTNYTWTTRTWVATDACGNVSAPVSQKIINDCTNQVGGFAAAGTGWAYSSTASTPFSSISPKSSNNWGWTNGLLSQSSTSYKFTLYVGAGQSNLTKGAPVGDVTVTYTASGVVVTYNVVSACKITEAHLYIGKTLLPLKKGTYVSSPGQLGFNSGTLSGVNTYTFTVSKLSDGTTINGSTGSVYVAAHAVIELK